MVFVWPGAKDDTPVAVRSSPGSSKAIAIPNRAGDPPLQELLPSFLSTAFRSRTYDCFITAYTPHSADSWPRLPTNLAVLPSTTWLQAAIAVAPADAVLNNSLTAIALAQVGRKTGQPDLLYSSRRLYTKALSGLNKKLSCENESLTDTTLAVVSALSLYEMQEGSGYGRAKNWASHVKGASTLIHLRGKSNFSTPLSVRVFLGTQIAEFIAAIGSRKRSSNASLWSQMCQDSDLGSKFASPLRLFEILQSLPEIMGEGENINFTTTAVEHPADKTRNLLVALTYRCQDFEMRITEWYNDLESRYQSNRNQGRPQPGSSLMHNGTQDAHTLTSKLYWFEPSTLYSQLPRASPARIFPFFVCFADPDIAHQLLLHWTGLLLMRSTLHLAHARLHPHDIDTSSPDSTQPTFSNHPHALALLIAQSLEYFVHPDMGLLGTNLIGFPLSVAQGYFQYMSSKEVLWFDVIFQRMREIRSGLGGFLGDMAKGDTIQLVRPWDRELGHNPRPHTAK